MKTTMDATMTDNDHDGRRWQMTTDDDEQRRRTTTTDADDGR